MLPPVLAFSASYATATEAKLRPEQPADSRATVLPAPPTPSTINQNSAIAGQLNIMLLSGPERMSQNLSVLAEVLGAALKIERRSDETPGDYMGRLIEGIATLPAADRLKLQRLLTQSFAGLQLRTLLEAMASPSGPERATLALYLELYRQPDRDGATRSVISSYREAASEARSTPQSVSRPMAANEVGRAPGDPQRPAPMAAEQNRSSSTPGIEAKVGADIRSGNGDPPSRPGVNVVLPTRTNAASASGAPAAPDAMSSADKSSNAVTATDQRQQNAAVQTLTSRATASGGPQPSSTESRTMQAQSGQTLPVPTNEAARQPEERARVGLGTPDRPTPSAPSATAVPVVAVPAQAGPTLPISVGWLAELLESDFVRTLLQLKNLSTVPQATALPCISAGMETQPQATLAERPVSSDETNDSTEQRAPMQDPTLPETADEQPVPGAIPLPEQVQARFPIAREGMSLPFIPYQLQGKFDTEHVDEQEDEDSGNREGEANAEEDDRDEPVDRDEDAAEAGVAEDGSPAGQPAGPYIQESLVAELHALPATSETALPLPPEPAHALYLRMAGLN